MKNTELYIKQEYGTYLEGFSFVKPSVIHTIIANDYILSINRRTLKIDASGIISNIKTIENSTAFIRVYNINTTRTRVIYPEQSYIYIKNRPKVPTIQIIKAQP